MELLASAAVAATVALAALAAAARVRAGRPAMGAVPAVRLGGRDVTEAALAVSALVALALTLAAGRGPVGPALATFALGVVAVLCVVSARRAAALRRARRAAERARLRSEEAQVAFVTDASHQLRTPLAALRLRLDDLGGRLEGTPLAATVDAATGEVGRLERLARGLLALSATPDAPEPRSLAEAAERAVATPLAGGAIALAVRRDATVRAAGLDDALAALVENAVVYGAGAVAVTVDGGRVEVSDTGPGLADGEHERVFERFARGSAAATRAEGAGLGLAIARAVARRAGGDVTLANRVREPGAIATLALPEVAP